MANLVKHSGQVFTPDYLVTFILDEAGYRGQGILRRHCIDNSCGDGAFLCEIVRRYCTEYTKIHGSTQGLQAEVRHYIHGIEIDPVAFACCKENVKITLEAFGISGGSIDIINGDTLTIHKFDNLMDFVVGNPPYVRVHNLEENFDSVKTYAFANGGMTDLYLVFFEIGLNMLRPGGKLCYITPSSWINSVAGATLRQYILANRNLLSVIDLEHFQPFKATTYTMISLFERGAANRAFDYYRYCPQTSSKELVSEIAFDEVSIKGYFYLADKNTLADLKAILTTPCKKYVSVKNGFATLADDVFISADFPFTRFVIDTIKASTGKWHKAFFPYDSSGKPLPKETIFSYPDISDYLNGNKAFLLKGKTEAEQPFWYLYGRTQALKDVASEKFAINTCIRDIKSIKLNLVASGQGVYSGLYILSDILFDTISGIILSKAFTAYVAALKKYKSGGYYTFNSKELEAFLNYKIQQLTDNGKIEIKRCPEPESAQGYLPLF